MLVAVSTACVIFLLTDKAPPVNISLRRRDRGGETKNDGPKKFLVWGMFIRSLHCSRLKPTRKKFSKNNKKERKENDELLFYLKNLRHKWDTIPTDFLAPCQNNESQCMCLSVCVWAELLLITTWNRFVSFVSNHERKNRPTTRECEMFCGRRLNRPWMRPL